MENPRRSTGVTGGNDLVTEEKPCCPTKSPVPHRCDRGKDLVTEEIVGDMVISLGQQVVFVVTNPVPTGVTEEITW